MIGYFVYFFSLSAGQVTTSIKNEEKQTNNKKQKTKDEKQIIHNYAYAFGLQLAKMQIGQDQVNLQISTVMGWWGLVGRELKGSSVQDKSISDHYYLHCDHNSCSSCRQKGKCVYGVSDQQSRYTQILYFLFFIF